MTHSNKSSKPEDEALVVDLYKMLVEMADRVSQRRQAANSFYLSVNTALIGVSAYLSTFRPSWVNVAIVALAGLGISVLWIRNITSYKELNRAKFHVITEIEKSLPISPFTDEWALLDPDGDGKRYKPFHVVEVAVPWVFAVVQAVSLAISLPWLEISKGLSRLL